LHRLCSEKQPCDEFSQAAMGILSRYNDYENSIIAGSGLDLSGQQFIKRNICVSFEKLITLMKNRFKQHQASGYGTQAMRMTENRSMLRKTLLEVEDDLRECKNNDKIHLLEEIHTHLKEVIRYFSNLIENFKAVQNYE
ncbi:MAG: hypothetical protein GY862_14425, partial [Gammaproteobacteria bacterium]|nr:hypothetical protein [Gammaproteobacteria bacterium]